MTTSELEQARATRLDPLDLPNSTTRREADAYAAITAELDGRISRAKNAIATLADLELKIAPDVQKRNLLTTWREEFCQKLLAIKPSDRDRATMERQNGLRLSIENIDRGCSTWPNGAPMIGGPLADAIREAGYTQSERPGPAWFGSLSDVVSRIADVQKRIDTAQAQLDEALLDDAERAQRDAEGAARIAASNAMPQRKVRGDGTQYDRWPDGRVVEVTS
jgi:hypothetical protein